MGKSIRNAKEDVKIVNYGQVFTREKMVEFMMSLIENRQGIILEPSVGIGNFYFPLVSKFGSSNVVGIELDSDICPIECENCDFFAYSPCHGFDVIIGNPPYVKYNKILESTRKLIRDDLDGLSNLYLHFMWKCIDLLNDGGELIFVVPRDFIKTTSARPLNRRLFNEGGFTMFKEFGDENTFDNASPNVAIFRWVKGGKHVIQITENDGFLSFSSKLDGIMVGDVFDVYVGCVSGDNKKYYSDDGNIELIVSTTVKDGKTKKAIYDEKNKWIRKPRNIPGRKIFVNSKTRNKTPFYVHDCCYFDGSVLCLKPKTDKYSVEELCNLLNSNDWDVQGFKVGGRLVFGQKNIQNAIIRGLN